METFLACILLWPVNFAPVGWALCAGQTLSIAQNTALFSLLGTTYGGNGQTTFLLPNLQGRVPIGAGNGAGLSPYVLGQTGGNENTTLTTQNLPSHAHTFTVSASNAQATVSNPAAGTNTLAAPYDTLNTLPIAGYNNQAPNTQLNIGNGTTGLTGNNIPINNIQPYLALNFIIALQGIYPSRN
ncbi:MAG: phage tail protein [Bacteroidetes bacterium]|nr:phage tail protein [Bacteroidota bacterium]